jgi:nucleotide-binding universal stress UspA family protein
MYKRIVVPLDGSDVAEQALDPAIEMARLMHLPVHLVRVLDVHPQDIASVYGAFVMPIDSGELEAEREAAGQYLKETTRLLEQGGQVITHELKYGPAQAGIVETLRDGDMLVIASHGRSGMSRWFLGSVAESVIRQSPVPVLLIRAKQAKARRSEARPLAAAATA